MSHETTQEEVRQRVREWLIAFNAKDRESLYALFHPDMIYANDGFPLMRGPGEIQPWYEQAFGVMTGRALFREEAIVIEGAMALAVGKFYFEPADPAAPAGETGRVAMIWRRDANNQWLLAFDMDNRPPDAKPEDFAGVTDDAYVPVQGAPS